MEGDNEAVISDREIERQIGKLKRRKAAGIDGLENKAWLFSEGQIRGRLKELLKTVWIGEGFPEKWRRSLIVPIHKKGDISKVENYRGDFLLCTAYKIYAGILTEKLRKEIKEKKALPETQAGFRRSRSTMDNVYVVNHIIKKELKKKAGKVFGFFMDLRAAFDRVDRRELWKAMERRGIRTGIVERVKEIYEGTESAVREREENSNWFWTEKGLRQGCPISLLLFALWVADIEEELSRGQVGGSGSRKGKDMVPGLCRRYGAASKKRGRNEGNDEKDGKIREKEKTATERRKIQDFMLQEGRGGKGKTWIGGGRKENRGGLGNQILRILIKEKRG